MTKCIRPPRILPDGSVEISLTKGQIAVIDPIDTDLSEMNWAARKGAGGYYAYKTVTAFRGMSIEVFLHNLILEREIERKLGKYETCDHIDGNSLNNRRNNLRPATHQQNMQNRKRNSRSTSPYKGISFHKQMRKWQARIRIPTPDGKSRSKSLGLFDTPEEAYVAYCEAALKYHGEFARFE